MIYIEAPGTEPEFNLALEEFVFDYLPQDETYFMLWQNENAVIVGKNQNTEAEINHKYVEEQQIHVVRRLSGGGAVYHDSGNLNFTFITDVKDAEQLNLHMFCQAMAEALQALGVDAVVNGRNDITIDGKKFSGNAQYIKRGRIMHHGTIMFDSDLNRVSLALRVSKDKLEGKGTNSVRSRVTNVKEYLKTDMTLEEFKKHLLQYVFREKDISPYHFSEEELKKINHIRDTRYALWNWNYGESPACTLKREGRIDGCGKIEAYFYLEKGIIHQLEFHGDYFGIRDTQEIADAMKGCRLIKQEIDSILSNYDIGQYFHGCSKDSLIGILFDLFYS